ncbi:MAG: PASTA domain-containing protein, partial [Deltaproteobacteria bacterium]|nr:PASTA domain-containing protein [Deltaproteobacteria bacterium]
PVTAAAVGVPYTYGVQAHDPDLDDVLTFSLPTAPTGMTINTATGLIQWTPTSSQRGAQSVVVRVQDQTGLFSLQNFTATVGDPVTVPNVVGQPQAAAQTTLTAAGLTVGIVTTAPSDTVPAGNVISQTPAAGSVAATGAAVNLVISSGPQGIIIPNVVGQPQAAAQSAITNAGLTLGTVTTAPSNTVPAGRVISQTPAAGAVVAAGTAVNLVISTGAVSLADLASIVVDPESPIILVGQNQPFTATGVFNDGTSQNLTAIVTWTSSSPSVAAISPMGVATGAADGTTTIKASVSGIMGSSVLTVRAKVAGDSTLPTAAITAPANDQEVTAPVNVIGTATDANFLKYELAYAVAGDTNFTLLATSSSPVTNGVLSSLDPTLLINDLYTLQLTVFDRGGNTATASVTVQVTREQKVGLFTITFQDLSIPLSGIPITINRTYDSRDKGQGDFGIGWRLDVQTMRIRTNRVLGTGWVRGQSGAVITLWPTDAHKVSLTLPDGKVEEFDMQVSPTSGLGGLDFTSVTGFTPRPGTLGKLEALANNSLAILNAGVEDELVDDTTLNTYTPQLFRYTTVDGTQIEIHRTQGVRKVTDLNGNTLTFGPNGILHSAGKSVTFTRDALGRITQITDPNGKSQNYAYNANGDLISHTDQLGNVTRFSYNSTHGLLQIIDPLNRPAIRNEYDATGRLIAQTDAQGNRVTYTHNLNTRQEVITDQLGRTTVVEYDAAGNVVATTDALGHRSTATFDSVGNQLTSTNPLGQTITRTYDNKRNLLTWTDPLGRTTTYTRDANGRPLTITDPRGNTSTMAYDAQGSLIRTTNALGQVTASTYDSAGNMTSLTDPPNTTTKIQYDSAGRRTQLTDPLGTATQMGYDNNGNLLSQHSASGPGWALSYDAKNRIVVTGLGGLQRSFTYDAAGQISKVTIASGEQVPVTFDAVGRLTAIGTPGSGAALQQTYDAVGNTLTVTDAVGNVVNRTYDAANRPISTQRPDGSTEQRSYDAAGRLVQVTDALGHATRFSSDAAGQLTTVTDALGGQTVFQYDANGNKTAVTDPAGRTTQFSYDALNRQTKTTFADGTTESRVYDAAGRIVQFTDAAGNVTTYAYDILGRLLSVTDPLGHITRHDYQGAVQRTATTDANGNTTRFAYDAAGRLIKTTYPMGESETASYDAAGHVLTRTNGKGETIQYQYDTSGRLTGVGLAGGATQSFTYTTDQHLATMTDTRGTTTIDYDPQTRLLVRVTGPDGRYVRYAYDVIGNRTLIAHGDASSELVTQYAYDALNRATQITDANGGVTTQSYDAAGNVTAIARPNGVTSRITYDWRSRISAITDLSPSNTILTGETYSRDTLGNVTNVARNDGSHVEYQYDTLGRVTHERHLDSANTVTFESVDGYDAAGNRITSGPPAAPLTYTYNADNQLVTGGGVTFTYDAAGRRVQRQAKDGAGGPDTFLVDRDNVTGFSQIVRESGAGVNRSFVYGSQLLQMGDNGVTQYRHFDALGSTRALTGTTGAVSDTFDYQAYGGVLSHTGTSGIPHRFAGEESDPESGLSYLRARYYDPRTGGFLSRDSELGDPSDPLSLNPYLYAAENPVNRRDPSGHETIPELLVAAYNQVIAQGQRVLNYRHVLGEVSKVTADVTRFVGGLLAFDALVEASRSKARLEKWFGTARFVAFADILAGLGLDGIADIVTGAEYTIDALAFFGLAKTALDMLSGKVGGTDVNIHIQGLGVFTASSISEAVKDLKADTTAGASCAEGRFAYASPPPEGEGPLIGLCTDFFSRPVLPDLAAITIPDKPSMAGVMVHEFTHISIHTNDDAYNCVSYYSGSLGARISGVYTGAGHPGFISSALPLRNADSYECWVEDSAVGTPLP